MKYTYVLKYDSLNIFIIKHYSRVTNRLLAIVNIIQKQENVKSYASFIEEGLIVLVVIEDFVTAN